MSVEFTVNGDTVECPEGFSLAGALYLLGTRVFGSTPRGRAPRAMFCGMGICYECVVKVDGRSNVRACRTIVRPGMQVTTQDGDAELETVA